MAEAVKEVFAAEKRAVEITTQAQAKKERIIADAKLKAVKLLEEEKGKWETRFEKELERKRKAIDAERKEILDAAQEEAAKLRKKAAANSPKAVELILKELDAA